jgi:hypothetical protein
MSESSIYQIAIEWLVLSTWPFNIINNIKMIKLSGRAAAAAAAVINKGAAAAVFSGNDDEDDDDDHDSHGDAIGKRRRDRDEEITEFR